MNNLIAELQWRGMIQDIMPGTEEQLSKEMTTGYIGFDPTADSLHIGNLVPIILLIHLQKCGHKPIALVGGATFTGAVLRDSLMDGAQLDGSDFRGALGLSAAQVCSSHGWLTAQFDADVLLAVQTQCGGRPTSNQQ